jgi:hypothetical protein
LDCQEVRQLDRLLRDGNGLRPVRVVRGQLVEQPVRVGHRPQIVRPDAGEAEKFVDLGGDAGRVAKLRCH